MDAMRNSHYSAGLTSEEARELQKRFGRNEITAQKKKNLLGKIAEVLCEPMFLLLIAAATIYFILGEPLDGIIMLVFVTGIISIDIIQQWKTDRTLQALKDLSAPQIGVVRDGAEKRIPSAELVPGDLMLISEGVKIPADGLIVKASDLSVDESSLTGESEGVWKLPAGQADVDEGEYWRRDTCYAGTLVTQGTAEVLVKKTGPDTEYGRIGKDVAEAPDRPTPLEKQTGKLVRLSAGVAAVLFALVSAVTYLNVSGLAFGDRVIQSVLSGITLAMAMIPEEFPVILTVFLSLGAWRLAKKHSLVRRLPAVETLGAVSVLCVDKTGTITLNRMTVRETWAAGGDTKALCRVAGMACETQAYDPMEKAILSYCEAQGAGALFDGELVLEYPFTNETRMMGHVWGKGGGVVIAAKGSPESVTAICAMTEEERESVQAAVLRMSEEGLRVIAVGEMRLDDPASVPQTLQECELNFCGLIGLADPPRESVKEDIALCVRAGIRVVMITGDSGVTAASIARQVGMPGCDKIVTGKELDAMTDAELRERVRDASIFARVVPEHKMRIVRAFRDNGDVVAMTGDGVNDAPALKYADIGIAMGKRGSEVSREAADLVLLDDNFTTIVQTVRDGRRIFDNIRKAVGYVLAIHVPIALASLFAPMLGLTASLLMLLPLHIVLLELIIDPTCSVVLERQPAEKDVMERPPRKAGEKIIGPGLLIKSIAQGLALFAASFGAYYLSLTEDPSDPALARTMGLAILFLGNVLLVMVNASDSDTVFASMRRLGRDWVMWMASAGTVALLLVMVYTPLNAYLRLAPLSFGRLLLVAGVAGAATLWYELVKLAKRRKAGAGNSRQRPLA